MYGHYSYDWVIEPGGVGLARVVSLGLVLKFPNQVEFGTRPSYLIRLGA